MALFSILDLAFVSTGTTPPDAFRNSLDLAQHAERWFARHLSHIKAPAAGRRIMG